MVDTEQPQGARPARTTYRVTDEGEKEFHQILRETWWETKASAHPLLPAVAMPPFTDREHIEAALKARVQRLESDAMLLQRDIARIESGSGDPVREAPYHLAEMQRLMLALAEAELAWTTRLADRIESGTLDAWSLASPWRHEET